jgi:hypothetical protein
MSNQNFDLLLIAIAVIGVPIIIGFIIYIEDSIIFKRMYKDDLNFLKQLRDNHLQQKKKSSEKPNWQR